MKFRQMFSRSNRCYLLLLTVVLVSLFVRVWILDKRWINPDEGAHLMDAVLVLDGKIPQVDFHARQPLYVYATAGFLKLFGTNYISGRLFSLTCSMLTGLVIFLIAKTLFYVKVGLLSSVIYWMLPLELLQSAIVKTEPLTMLLTSLSLYTAIRFSQHSKGGWLIVAGVLAAMGYYVRESSLILPVTVLAFIVFSQRGRVRGVAKNFGFFLIGYISVFLLVLGFYSMFMSRGDLLTSNLNPLRILGWAGGKLLSLTGLSVESTASVTPQASDITWLYHLYLRQAFHLHSFLLIGLGFSLLVFCYNLLIHNGLKVKEYLISHSILYLWVFSLLAAYVFFYFASGFYIDYAREFLPPLVIIFSAFILNAIPALAKDGNLEKFIIGGLCLSAGLFFIESHYEIIGIGYHASIAVALFALFSFMWSFESSARRLVFLISMVSILGLILFSRQPPLEAYFSGTVPSLVMIGIIYSATWLIIEKKVGVSLAGYGKFVCTSILLASFVVSLSYSANLLNLAYDSVWSPQSVEKAAGYLKAYTANDDEVMSGAVIWELQALRMPFLTISHPTAFIGGMSEKKRESIRNGMRSHPPKVIILDGYTEKTYLRRLPWLTELLEARYRLLATVGPAKYPVDIYLEAEPIVSTDNL